MLTNQSVIAICLFASTGACIAAAEGTDQLREDPQSQFRIMTPDEIDHHVQAMKKLKGEARENYRDAEYQQLAERAREHGYHVPEVPPWQAAVVAPVPDVETSAEDNADTDPKAGQTAASKPSAPSQPLEPTPPGNTPDLQRAAREQRELIEHAVSDAEEAAEPSTADQTTAPGDGAEQAAGSRPGGFDSATNAEYRKTMRQRFDHFMAQRQAELEKRRQERDAQFARQARERRQATQERFEQMRTPRPPFAPAPPPPAYPPYPAPPYWPQHYR